MVNQKYVGLKRALQSARLPDFMTSTPETINHFIQYAQENSEIPIALSVIDYIQEEYRRHQHERDKSRLVFLNELVRAGFNPLREQLISHEFSPF